MSKEKSQFKYSDEQMKKLEKFSDKQLNTYSIIFICLAVLLFLLGAFTVVTIILGVIPLLMAIYYKGILKQRNNPEWLKKIEAEKAASAPVPESKKNYNLFDDIIDEDYLAYEYELDLCADKGIVAELSGNGGKEIVFEQEPENQYDNKAVRVLFNGKKIGYVYRGQHQDMINDWIKRNWLYVAYLNKIDVDNNKATYKVGFYKSLNNLENKTFSVAKISKRAESEFESSRYDNISCCSEGDIIDVDYNRFDDKYVLYSGCDEIGELPKSAESFIGEHKAFAILEELEEEDEKISAKVRVYVK